MRLHRRVRQLDSGTSVRLAPPQSEFRMHHVGDPLAIARDIGLARRDPGKVDGELLRFAFKVDQIEPALLADHEQLLSIHARSGIAEQEGSQGQLSWRRAGLAKKRRPFTKSPDVLGVVARRFKEKVVSIWRPGSSKFLGRLVPVRQHRVQTLAVWRNLPERRHVLAGVPDGEAQAAAIGRKTGRKRNARYGDKLPRIGSVGVARVQT